MSRPFISGGSEKGASTLEYGIMLALVAVVVAFATPNIRDAVVQIFSDASAALTAL